MDGTPVRVTDDGRLTWDTPSGRRPSVFSRAPETLARGLWRHRWQLAPLPAATGVLLPALTHPTPVVVGCAAVTAASGAWARKGRPLAGRMWLSARERAVVAQWAGASGAASWAIGTWDLGPGWAAAALAAATAWPTWTWVTGRAVRSTRLDSATRAALKAWRPRIATDGPAALRGSAVLWRTVTRPAPGAATFVVQLADGVHAAEACTSTVQRAIEAGLRLGIDTCQIDTIRDDATRVRVMLTPGRHLEVKPVAWSGPRLHRRGSTWEIQVADALDGGTVAITYADRDGVRHLMVSGTSNVGKSTTLTVIVLSSAASGHAVQWLLDGKGGTSMPYLRGIFDWYATKPHQWGTVIDVLFAVYVARRERRGDAALHAFRVGHETDPVIELIVDEGSAVVARLTGEQQRRYLEMAQQGRALGIRLVQAAQDVMASGFVGGRQARDLLSGNNGAVVAHRPAGSLAKRLTSDSTGESVDLMALPPDPGFVAVMQGGRVLAQCARVHYADPDVARGYAEKIAGRGLSGEDAMAAGAAYLSRHDATAPREPSSTMDGVDAGEALDMAASDAEVLAALRAAPDGLRLGELQEACPAVKRRTISNALARLARRDIVEKTGPVWTVSEDSNEEPENES
jgi:hypothetical protein